MVKLTGLVEKLDIAVEEVCGSSSNLMFRVITHCFIYLFIYLFILGPHLQHMDVPGLGAKLELHLPA